MSKNSLNQASAVPEARIELALHRLRRLSHWMDEAIRIPVLGWRFGVQPVIGLVPGIGDLLGLLITAYGVQQAWVLGAPRGLVLRMIGNALLDFLIGLVPGLGDLADAAFKANTRNLRLLERHLEARLRPPAPRRRWSAWLLWAGLVGTGLLMLGLLLRTLLGG